MIGKMTLMSVSKWARLKVDKEGHRDQRLTADGAAGNDKEILLLRGMEVSKGVIQRQRENQRRGRRANIPTQASWPVIEGRRPGGF